MPHTPGYEVCLFVKDVDKDARDYTPSIDECEALLKKHGVTNIKEVNTNKKHGVTNIKTVN